MSTEAHLIPKIHIVLLAHVLFEKMFLLAYAN